MRATRRWVVVGAGVVGVCVASFLVRDGYEVTLLDPNDAGTGASSGNAGGLNPASIVPMATPGIIWSVPRWLADPLGPLTVRWTALPRLAPWIWRFHNSSSLDRVEAAARSLRGLLSPCFDLLLPLADQAQASHLLRRLGGLYVYRSRGALAKSSFAWELRRRNGVELEELDAASIRRIEPALSADYACGIRVQENGHTLDPQGLVQALAGACVRAGVSVIRGRALGFRMDGNRLVAVRTDEGDIDADGAVIAAGVHSRALARDLGNNLPLESERGYHLMIRDPEVHLHHSVMDGEGKFVATGMAGGLRIAGTVELAGVQAPPDWRRARILAQHAHRMIPDLPPAYDPGRMDVWMGHRPSMPDSLPVIDRSVRCPQVIYAFGHGHVGLTAAPMTGRIVADLAAGRPAPIDLSPFRATGR